MKKILIYFVFISFSAYAQNNTYHISYKLDKYIDGSDLKKEDSNKMMNEIMKQVDQIRKELTFELLFNDSLSVFRMKKILIPDGKEFIYALASGGGSTKKLYIKNLKTKYRTEDFTGDIFNVSYPYNQYDWTITEETKNINGYTCYKATTTWEEYDHGREMTLKFSPFVWFTYDIPHSYGPKGLDGLPGLVLEGSFNGVMYFKVSKINKNSNVKFPKIEKVNEVSYIEYSKMIGEHMKTIRRN